MYPHEITIVRHAVNNHEDIYSILHETDVFIYGTDMVKFADGFVKAISMNVLISRTDVDINKGDIVLLGNYDIEIEKISELDSYKRFTVTGIAEYKVESQLDCTLITGE